MHCLSFTLPDLYLFWLVLVLDFLCKLWLLLLHRWIGGLNLSLGWVLRVGVGRYLMGKLLDDGVLLVQFLGEVLDIFLEVANPLQTSIILLSIIVGQLLNQVILLFDNLINEVAGSIEPLT